MKKLLVLSLLLLGIVTAHAQRRTVSGVVRDGQGGSVPFANVNVRGTKTTVQSDENGRYKIEVDGQADLIFSATGFREASVRVNGTVADVSLQRSENALQEVVVTTTGLRQRRDLGYSTAKIDNRLLTQATPVNIANGLQGKVSGLNITSVNNSVFGDVRINLRGIRSLTGNNNPMLLIDGVQQPLSLLASLNPNDVQDVSVLKGASSAGIYGSDARNGVIVVTTKKGSRGNVPTVTVAQTTQFEKFSFLPEFQTKFGSGYSNSYVAYENWSWGPAFDGTIRPVGKPLEDGSQQMQPYSYLSGEKERFFNTGITNQTDVSFGMKDFYLSLQDVRISGITPRDENRRIGVRFNSAREYGRFKVGYGLNYVQQNYDIFDQNQMERWHLDRNTGLNGGLLNLIFNTPGHIPLTSYKNFETDKFSQFNGYFNDYGLNPYFAIDNWRQKGKVDNLIGNLDLGFKVADWLILSYRGGISVVNTEATGTSKGETPSAYAIARRSFASIPGAFSTASNRSSRIISEFSANASKQFGDFKTSLIVGHFLRQNDLKASTVGAANLVVPEIFNAGNRTGELVGSNSTSQTRLVAAFANATINYKGFANLEFSGRNEWTSVLPKANNSYFFPTVSTSVVASDVIGAFKNSRWINYLKIRASWAKTGNADINAYALQPVFASGTGFPYGSLPGFTAENTAFDPNLKPEFTTSKEIGFEASFLKSRINLEATYFHQDNEDLFLTVRVSDATGYRNLFTNAGAFINKGVELDLKLTPLVKLGDFNFDLNLNATYNDSRVTRIYEGLDRIFVGGFNNFASNFAVVGQPAFVFLLTDYTRDSLGRVIIDPATGLPTADPTVKQFGRSQPLWVAGINPRLSYKGFSLSMVAEYRGGHSAYHNIGPDMAWTGISSATAVNNRERFVFPNSSYWDGAKYVPNTNNPVQSPETFFTTVYRNVASNFFTSAASWRIRELSLSYELPASLLGKLRVIKGATVSVNVRNLALRLPTSNKYTDPDFNFTAQGNSQGINTSQITPPTRLYGFNVNLRF